MTLSDFVSCCGGLFRWMGFYMGKLPAFQFYPGDWLRDPISHCSLAAQGLWLRLMIVAHDCVPYGELRTNGRALTSTELARRCGCDLAEFNELFSELESNGVPSVSDDGAIVSRRMVRDGKERGFNRTRQKKFRDRNKA